jgi:lipopolysaccharide assembly protein A
MRWVYLVVIALFALATLIFALQNLEVVAVSFLGFKVRAPLSVVTILFYVLGALTGGSLSALLRRSYERSQWNMGSS